MNQRGPIILIEDDEDDLEIITEIFNSLNYETIAFLDGELALSYLVSSRVKPFLILSDINLPKLTGFELRAKVLNNEQLRLKCTPYLFFTTASSEQAVIDAYSQSVQGFFVKPSNIKDLEAILKTIVEYWQSCKAPRIII